MNSVRSNNHRFTPSGRNDIGIRKFELVAKTPFLSKQNFAVKFGWQPNNQEKIAYLSS